MRFAIWPQMIKKSLVFLLNRYHRDTRVILVKLEVQERKELW